MRSELPAGTVTFLFTDVEGSTQLLHELGADRYAEALAEHRRLVRDAVARHGGVEVDAQGDAFFVAFPTAPGALQAAADAQEALAGRTLKVRMGLHTGTPLLTDEGTSVPTCIARRASLQRATAGRCSFRPRPRCWFERATVCPSSISGYTVSKTSRPRSGSPSSAGTSSCR